MKKRALTITAKLDSVSRTFCMEGFIKTVLDKNSTYAYSGNVYFRETQLFLPTATDRSKLQKNLNALIDIFKNGATSNYITTKTTPNVVMDLSTLATGVNSSIDTVSLNPTIAHGSTSSAASYSTLWTDSYLLSKYMRFLALSMSDEHYAHLMSVWTSLIKQHMLTLVSVITEDVKLVFTNEHTVIS